MYENYKASKEENTKLTLESYGNVYRFEANHCDCDMEELLYAFYGLLIGATWSPTTVLEEMKFFADERLKFIKSKEEIINEIGVYENEVD